MLAGKDITMMDGLMISITGILMVFLELLLLSLIVTLISKVVSSISNKKSSNGKGSSSSDEASVSAPAGTPLPETESVGTIDLVNVTEEEAAMIMAIVSNQSGIPLNKLSFKSIKLVEENK